MKINAEIIEISSVDSTNDYAFRLLKNTNLDEGTIVWAHFQKNGKGQKENSWYSENRKNITCSIVLYPHFLPIEKQFYLSIVTSLSIIDFLKNKIKQTSIKWPNDIYYKHLKLGGILVENTISGTKINSSIIGIGLNINQKKFPVNVPNPVSLLNIVEKEYRLKDLIEELAGCFHYNYGQLKQGYLDKLKSRYMDKLYKFNKTWKFKDSEGEFFGKITDVLETGELIIIDESKQRRHYMFKEVEFAKS